MNAFNKFTVLGVLLVLLSFGVKAPFTEGDFELGGDCFKITQETYVFQNNSAGTKNYTLTATGDGKDWINVSGKQIALEPLKFTLKAGESKEMPAFIKPCCCTLPKTYTIGLKVTGGEDLTQVISFRVKDSRKISLALEPEIVEIGQCEKGEVTITVKNESQITEDYRLEVSGINEGWLELATTEFSLEKDSEREIKMFIQPPCDQKLGEYAGTLTVKIDECPELSEQAEVKVKIVDKQYIAIGSKEELEFGICNDVQEEREITVENLGRAEDSLKISIEGPDWMQLREKAMTIKAGEKKTLHLLLVESDADEGEYTATITAQSTKYGKETSAELKVMTEDCYNLTVEKTKGAEEACIENPLSYEFSLTNPKDTEISVSLSVEGLSATVNPKTLTLRPKESKSVTAAFDLEKEKPGKKEFALKVLSDNFKTSRTYGFELMNCYDLLVDYDGIREPIEIVISKGICQWEEVFTLKATNTGTMEQEVEISAGKVEWVTVEPAALDLKPDETKEFYVYVTPPLQTEEGSYTEILAVKARDYSREQRIKIDVSKVEGEKPCLEAGSELEETIVTEEKTVKVKVMLTNTGNCALNITGVSSKAYSAAFEFEPFTLERGEEKVVNATLQLGKGFDAEEVELPLSIQTDRGILTQNVTVSLVEEAEEETPGAETGEEKTEEAGEEEEEAMPGGLLVLAPGTVNLLILLFLAIVAVVIVMLAYYAYAKTPSASGRGKGSGWYGEPHRHSKAAKKGKRK